MFTVAACDVEIFVITHDVDINISFILTLAIAEYNLVDARLVSPGIDDRQVHIVGLDRKVDILPNLQLLSVLHHNHLQRGLDMSNYLEYCYFDRVMLCYSGVMCAVVISKVIELLNASSQKGIRKPFGRVG